MKRVLLASLIMIGCGPVPQEKDESTVKETEQTEPEKVVVEYEKHDDVYVQLFEFMTDVPECTEALFGKLAKVRSVDKVFECERGSWVETDLNPDEVKVVRDDTPDMPEGENVWRDPVSKVIYLIGDQFNRNVVDYVNLCGEGWNLATRSEAQSAIVHGLLLARGTVIKRDLLYIQDGNPDDEPSAAIDVASGKVVTALPQDGQGMLCVLKK